MFDRALKVDAQELGMFIEGSLRVDKAEAFEQLKYGAMLLDFAGQHGIEAVRAAVEDAAQDIQDEPDAEKSK